MKPSDYSKVFDGVQLKVPHRNFLILAAPNNLGHARVGLIFSKKNLKLAVQRNRIKRQVRETFRKQQDLPALDIIVLGRQGLAQLENAAVHSALDDIWHRVKKQFNKQLEKTYQKSTSEGSTTTSRGTD
ncbi:hypothetical protein Q666_02905 [Marinobacter sp. ES-1]|nr:hypothetical protein Q666_02905 [Marinobacter sp. ES-1]